jgi:hypothetical protein
MQERGREGVGNGVMDPISSRIKHKSMKVDLGNTVTARGRVWFTGLAQTLGECYWKGVGMDRDILLPMGH